LTVPSVGHDGRFDEPLDPHLSGGIPAEAV